VDAVEVVAQVERPRGQANKQARLQPVTLTAPSVEAVAVEWDPQVLRGVEVTGVAAVQAVMPKPTRLEDKPSMYPQVVAVEDTIRAEALVRLAGRVAEAMAEPMQMKTALTQRVMVLEAAVRQQVVLGMSQAARDIRALS